MPCEVFTTKGGTVRGFICTRGPKKLHRCGVCGQPGDKLCDWPMPDGKTCDAQLCDKCAVQSGPNLDYCPHHKRNKGGKHVNNYKGDTA